MTFSLTRSHPTPMKKNRKAFALVLALALMGFMVLLVVTLAAIVQMQLRITRQSITDAKARQTAKFSAYQALNQVQKSLGPDKRITANASMFEDLSTAFQRQERDARTRYDWWENPLNTRRRDLESLSGAQIKNNYWVGVWESGDGFESKERSTKNIKIGMDETRKEYRERVMNHAKAWLVSGNIGKEVDGADNLEDRLTSLNNAGQRFEHLPSDILEPDKSITVVSAASAADESGEKGFDEYKRGVSVPLVTLKESEEDSFNATSQKRIAWWVSDEGQKASINAIASNEMFEVADANAKNFYKQSLPYYSGVQGLTMPVSGEKAVNLDMEKDPAARDVVRSLSGPGDLDFIKAANVKNNVSLGKIFFHDLTADTKGVLVNVRYGGLKKDLSLGLLQSNRKNDGWTNDETPREVSVSERFTLYTNSSYGIGGGYFPRPIGQTGYNFKISGYNTIMPPENTTKDNITDRYKFNYYTSLSEQNAYRRPTGHMFGPQLPLNSTWMRRFNTETNSRFNSSNIDNIWHDNSFHKDPGGPLWDQLRSYYNFRAMSSNYSKEIRTRLQSDDRIGFYPVLQRFQVYFVPTPVRYTSNVEGSESYGIRMHMIPIAVLWNPYDVKIAKDNYYLLHIETTGATQMGFRIALGVKKNNYFHCLRDIRAEKLNAKNNSLVFPTNGFAGGSTDYGSGDRVGFLGYGGIVDLSDIDSPKIVPAGDTDNLYPGILYRRQLSIRQCMYPLPIYLNDIYLTFGYNPDLDCDNNHRQTPSPYKKDNYSNNAGDLRFIIYDDEGIMPGAAQMFMPRKCVNYFKSFRDMYNGRDIEDTYLRPFHGSRSQYGSLYVDVPHPARTVAALVSNSKTMYGNPYVLFDLAELREAVAYDRVGNINRNLTQGDMSLNNIYIDIQNLINLHTQPTQKAGNNDYKTYYTFMPRRKMIAESWSGNFNPAQYYRTTLHFWNIGRREPYRSSDERWADGIEPAWIGNSTIYVRGPVLAYFRLNRDASFYDFNNPKGGESNPSYPDSLCPNSAISGYDDGYYNLVRDLRDKTVDMTNSDGDTIRYIFSVYHFFRQNGNSDAYGIDPRRASQISWQVADDLAPTSVSLEDLDIDLREGDENYCSRLYSLVSNKAKKRVNMYGLVWMKPTAYNDDTSLPELNRKYLINNSLLACAFDYDYSPRDVRYGRTNGAGLINGDNEKIYNSWSSRPKAMYARNQAYASDTSGTGSSYPAVFEIPSGGVANVGLDGKATYGDTQFATLMHILRDNEVVTNPANLSAANLNFGPGAMRLYGGTSKQEKAREFYLCYGMQQVDSINQTYPIGNSLAPLRVVPERSYRISWVDGGDGGGEGTDGGSYYNNAKPRLDGRWDTGNNGISEERALIYDYAYHLNDILWDEYFFSTLPYRWDERDDDFSRLEEEHVIPRNPRMVYTANADMPNDAKLTEDASNKMGTFGETGFDTNAANLMINGPFNVNSTSIDAWKTLLNTHYGDTVDAYVQGRKHYKNKTPFVRWQAPFYDKHLESGTFRDPEILKGYRVLSEKEIEQLAVAIVENIKDRGPFYSMSDFVNRVVENRTTESIYNYNSSRGRNSGLTEMPDDIYINPRKDKNDSDRYIYRHTHMQKGVLQAAIDSTSINRIFHSSRSNKFIISSDGSSTIYNPNLTYLFRQSTPEYRLFHYPQDTWENWRAAIGPQAQGIPEYLMQQDILAKLGSLMTVRSDTFKIRAYGEIRNPLTNVVEGKAWCEMTVQRIPEYVDDSDKPWEIHGREVEIGPNFDERIGNVNLDEYIKEYDSGGDPVSISKINAKLGRRFKIVSFRWLNEKEI